MPVGPSAAEANEFLDELFTQYPWVKLHVGDPGAAGTSNPATNTARVQATMGAAAVAGSNSQKTNTAALEWTGVTGAEDYTHITGWSASSGGAFGWSGLMTANAVLVGDTFRIPVGDLDASIPVAS